MKAQAVRQVLEDLLKVLYEIDPDREIFDVDIKVQHMEREHLVQVVHHHEYVFLKDGRVCLEDKSTKVEEA